MDAHHHIQQHAAQRKRLYADARPANLARDIADSVVDSHDADLSKRLFFPEPPKPPTHSGGGGSTGGGGGGTGGGGGGSTGGGHNGGGGGSTGGTGGTGGGGNSGGGGGNGGTGNGGTGGDDSGDGAQSHPPPSSTDTPPSSTSTTTSTTKTRATSTQTSTIAPSQTLTTPSAPSFTTPDLSPTTVIVPTPSVSLAAAADSATTAGNNSSGFPAGPVIGGVAGGLVGLALLSLIIGVLWKKYAKKDDPYEANPFDKDIFHRHSAMLPNTYDEDDDHTGNGAGAHPDEMSEHHLGVGSSGGFYEAPGMAGMAGMGIGAGAAGAAAAAHGSPDSSASGPRPPTMFERHMNSPGAQFGDPSVPQQSQMSPPGGQRGMMLDYPPPMPSMPQMAHYGADPYAAAGVAVGSANVANPYAHLDRGHPPQQTGAYEEEQEQLHGRTGSNGSQRSNTSGASGYGSAREGPGSIGHHYGVAPPPQQFNQQQNPFGNDEQQHYQPQQQYQQPQQGLQPSLSVRNLLPGGPAQHGAGARPISTASVDPEDAYGGVW